VRSTDGYFGHLHEVRPRKLKQFPYAVYEARCKDVPSKLRVVNDLTNIGPAETNVHEYTVEERVEENSVGLTRYPCRHRIELQTRIPLDHEFPTSGDLHAGLYHLKITAIAATQQLSQSCWIWISQDRRTLRWCSKKEPLKKCENPKIKET
jgi:hypothetical protein